MQKYYKRSVLVGVLSLLCVASLLPAALPPVFSEIPSDYKIVVATKPLGQLNSKLSNLIMKMGIPLPTETPGQLDLLALATSEFGLNQVIDRSRGAAMAAGDTMSFPNTFVVYIPVKNGQSALTALGAVKNDQVPGVWTLAAGESYAKVSNGYLVIGPTVSNLQVLTGRPMGLKLDKSDEDLFSVSDIALSIDLSSTLPMVRGLLAMQAMQQPDLANNPAAMKFLNLALDRLSEIQTASIGKRISDSGINVSMNVQARTNTALASFLSDHPKADLKELSKLPQGNFTTAQVMNFNGEKIRPMINAVLNFLAEETTISQKIGVENINELRNLFDMKLDCHGVVGQYLSEDGSSAPSMMGMVTYSENVDKLLAASQKMCPLLTGMISQFGFQLPINYKSGAGTAAGLSYDEVQVDMSQLPLPPEAIQMIAKQWGGQPQFTEQFCKVDDKTLAVGIGPGNLEKILWFRKNGKKGMDKHTPIATCAKHLPSSSNSVTFYHLGNSLRQAASTMPPQAMMVMGLFTQINGTVGVALSMDEGRLEYDAYVPQETLVSVGKVVQQMMQMFSGGTDPSLQSNAGPSN